jgi:hypothetical protein
VCDLLYYELTDNPTGLAACADAVGGSMERLLDTTAASAEGTVFWGGNFDTTLTPPPFFRAHVLPWLAKAADRLHTGAREVAILGGIPSIALLPESMPEAEFDRFLDRFFVELGDGAGLVLGVSDTTPPGAEFERLVKIGERARAFGPVPGS